MDRLQAAQAVRLISALRAQLDEMTVRLAWVERTGATAKKRSVVSAMRCEATALRRDIDEARGLIDGLCSRYLSDAPNVDGTPKPVCKSRSRLLRRRRTPWPLR